MANSYSTPPYRNSGLPQRSTGPRNGQVALSYQPGLDPIPSGGQQAAYVLLDVAVGALAPDVSMPINLCLVLDQSKSMQGEKFDRVREAARYTVGQLTERDVLSMVTFNDRATVVLPPRFVDDRGALAGVLNGVAPKGGTELAAGMEWGISQLHDGLKLTGQAISSLLLLTDGRTYGDEPVCVELAEYSRKQGFLLTALGVGEEWNEDLLEKLATRCGSRSEYIDRPAAIMRAFSDHIERLRRIVGYNARISLTCGAGVQVGSVHRVRPIVAQADALLAAETNEQVYELGALVAGETQTLLVEMLLPPLPVGDHQLLNVSMTYQQATVGRARLRIGSEIRASAVPPNLAGQSLSDAVKSAAEKVLAYRQQRRAWQDLAQGNVAGATSRLRLVATQLLRSGQNELAGQVQAEADFLAQNGQPSEEGPKRIKYGTRGLGGTADLRGGRPGTRSL